MFHLMQLWRVPEQRRSPPSATKFTCVATVVAALLEISFGRCGVLVLCHKLHHTERCTLAEYFHNNCPDPYIVAILAHEQDHYPPQAHVRVIYSKIMLPS